MKSLCHTNLELGFGARYIFGSFLGYTTFQNSVYDDVFIAISFRFNQPTGYRHCDVFPGWSCDVSLKLLLLETLPQFTDSIVSEPLNPFKQAFSGEAKVLMDNRLNGDDRSEGVRIGATVTVVRTIWCDVDSCVN